jgi:hypothetical protein
MIRLTERIETRLAGVLALASFALTMAAVSIAARGSSTVGTAPGSRPDAERLLLDFRRTEHQQLLAAGARALSVALVIAVALELWTLTRRRNPSHSRAILVLGLVACAVVAATTALGFVELRDVARQFAGAGAQTTGRARDLLDADGALRAVRIAELAGGFAFGLWVSLASYEAMRVGLLTRFLAGLGVGGGLISAIGIPAGPALFLAWLASVGLLSLGSWPGGRPPAWDEGRAVPWSEVEARAHSLANHQPGA